MVAPAENGKNTMKVPPIETKSCFSDKGQIIAMKSAGIAEAAKKPITVERRVVILSAAIALIGDGVQLRAHHAGDELEIILLDHEDAGAALLSHGERVHAIKLQQFADPRMAKRIS
jgi:hypothetical protein